MSVEGDSARAETVLPFSFAEVVAVFDDLEAAFRRNPYLDIREWRPIAGGFHLVAGNELSGRSVDSAARVTREARGHAFRLRIDWASGLKQATEIDVAAGDECARLTVVDHYPQVGDPEDPRLADVDRTLVPWVAAIRRHLLARRCWGWLPGWRWWNERLLPGMAPRSRRIVRLLVWVSAIEFLVFIAAIFVLRAAD